MNGTSGAMDQKPFLCEETGGLAPEVASALREFLRDTVKELYGNYSFSLWGPREAQGSLKISFTSDLGAFTLTRPFSRQWRFSKQCSDCSHAQACLLCEELLANFSYFTTLHCSGEDQQLLAHQAGQACLCAKEDLPEEYSAGFSSMLARVQSYTEFVGRQHGAHVLETQMLAQDVELLTLRIIGFAGGPVPLDERVAERATTDSSAIEIKFLPRPSYLSR